MLIGTGQDVRDGTIFVSFDFLVSFCLQNVRDASKHAPEVSLLN